MEDLTEVLNLFDRNVEKVQQNLITYKRDVDTALQSLKESWSHVTRADHHIISVHNELLSSISKMNTLLIKTNLQLKLNRAEINLMNASAKNQESLKLSSNHTENHTNLDGVEVGKLDVQSATSKKPSPSTVDVLQLMDIKLASATEEPNKLSFVEIKPASEIEGCKSEKIIRSAGKADVPKPMIPPRKSVLRLSNGGKKNMSQYFNKSMNDVNDDKPSSSPKKLSQSNAEKFKEQEQGCKDKIVSSLKNLPKDQKQPPKIDQELTKPTTKLSPRDMTMLEDVCQCTSDVVITILGYNPKGRIRRGLFAVSNCRIHQPFASHGATKDTELTDHPISFATRQLGSSVRVRFTYICSPTKLYGHFVDDDSSPLIWSKDDVSESDRIFKRAPLPLDIVLALNSDGYYSRAQIIESNDGMFKIFYVDYGNTEIITINSLAICNNARSLKPHRAVCCFIYGIQLSSAHSPIKAIECVEYLKSKLLNVELNVKLIYRKPDNSYGIKLLGHHADILTQIMYDGYVEPRSANGRRGDKNIC